MRAFRMFVALAAFAVVFIIAGCGDDDRSPMGPDISVEPAGKMAVPVEGAPIHQVSIMDTLPQGHGPTRIQADGTLYWGAYVTRAEFIKIRYANPATATVAYLDTTPDSDEWGVSEKSPGSDTLWVWVWRKYKANTTGNPRTVTLSVSVVDMAGNLVTADTTLVQDVYVPPSPQPEPEPVGQSKAVLASYAEPAPAEKVVSKPVAATCETCPSSQEAGADGAGFGTVGTTTVVSGSQGGGQGEHHAPEQPTQPTLTNESMFVWGYININGKPASRRSVPLGTVVSAVTKDGLIVGRAETIPAGAYGREGLYDAMAVYRDDVHTPEKDGAVPGETIFLRVNGEPTGSSFEWTFNGDVVQINPDVQIPEPKSGFPDGIHVGVDEQIEVIYQGSSASFEPSHNSAISGIGVYHISDDSPLVAHIRVTRDEPRIYRRFVLRFVAQGGEIVLESNMVANDGLESSVEFSTPYTGSGIQRAFSGIGLNNPPGYMEFYGIWSEDDPVTSAELNPRNVLVKSDFGDSRVIVFWSNPDVQPLESFWIYRSEVSGERGELVSPVDNFTLGSRDAGEGTYFVDTTTQQSTRYFYTLLLRSVDDVYSADATQYEVVSGAYAEDMDWLLPIFWSDTFWSDPGSVLVAEIGQHPEATPGFDQWAEQEMPPAPPLGVAYFGVLVDNQLQERDIRGSAESEMEFVVKFVPPDYQQYPLELSWDPDQLPADATVEVAFILRDNDGVEIIHDTYEVDIRPREASVSLAKDSYAVEQGTVMFIVRRN